MLRFFKYRLPLKKPFKISGSEYLSREGILLCYKQNDILAFGEAAPLPGFSKEKLEEVETVLQLNRELLEQHLKDGTGNQVLHIIESIHHLPSLSFALDTLIHDLAAKQQNNSLAGYLFNSHKDYVETNATLSLGESHLLKKEAKSLINSGYKTLKFKVGEDIDSEKKLLSELRNEFPSVNLRIDANQAWTEEEAINHLKSIESLKIEYCEQPVAKENMEGLKRVKKSTTIPIAADESVRNKNDINRLLKSEAVDLLILKPTLIGTFENIFVTKRMADSHNTEVVFTTCLESVTGRSAIATLAAGLGSGNYAHGLSTGNFFKNEIGENPWLDKNRIYVSDNPGLGISVELEMLEEI